MEAKRRLSVRRQRFQIAQRLRSLKLREGEVAPGNRRIGALGVRGEDEEESRSGTTLEELPDLVKVARSVALQHRQVGRVPDGAAEIRERRLALGRSLRVSEHRHVVVRPG